MNFNDFFSTIKDTLTARWEEFLESPVYAQIKERYESLSPVGQKVLLWTGLAFALLFLYMIPRAFLSSADDAIAIFEEKKEQAQELLQVTQTSKALPPLPLRLSSVELKGAISAKLQEAGLSPEQIKGVNERAGETPDNDLIPSSVLQNVVDVEINQLNLKQMVDIEFQLSKISPLVKVVGLDMKAHPSDTHYYDVKYAVASFNVNETVKEKEIDPKNKPKSGTKSSKPTKSTPSDEEEE